MKIETRYNFGDKVWPIRLGQQCVTTSCTGCRGVGKILLLDGTSGICPLCHGKGSRSEYRPMAWMIDGGPYTVGKIEVAITDSKGMYEDGEEAIFENYKAQTNRRESYMCVETGIGSGTCYYVHHLFPTQEKAQKACDRLNTEKADESNDEAAVPV